MSLTGLFFLASHNLTSATTTVLHIAGERSLVRSINNSIVNYLATLPAPVTLTAGWQTEEDFNIVNNINTAPKAVFIANDGAGNTTIVETNLQGTDLGLYDTVHGLNPPGSWIDGTDPVVAASLSPATPAVLPEEISGGVVVKDPALKESPVDVTVSNLWQKSTQFLKPALLEVIPGAIGVQPVVPVVSKGTPEEWTNITTEQVKALWTRGSFERGHNSLPLSFFTGTFEAGVGEVYPTGLLPANGIRRATIQESGANDVEGRRAFQCWAVDASGNRVNSIQTAIANIVPTPVEQYFGVILKQGQSGYEFPEAVTNVLANGSTTSRKQYLISFLDLIDASRAFAGGARILSFNGVSLHQGNELFNVEAITNGAYPLWTYIHAYQANKLGTETVSVAQGIFNHYKEEEVWIGGIKLDVMHVSRHPFDEETGLIY